jgi:hypothetical protein
MINFILIAILSFIAGFVIGAIISACLASAKSYDEANERDHLLRLLYDALKSIESHLAQNPDWTTREKLIYTTACSALNLIDGHRDNG